MLVSAIKNNERSLNKFRKAVLLHGIDNCSISHQPHQSPGTCTYKRRGNLETFNCQNLMAVFDNGTIFLYGHNSETVDDLLGFIKSLKE